MSLLSSSFSQWTSEPYESIDATYSNTAITVKDSAQSGDRGHSQGLDKTQEDSASASTTAPEATDQKTVWEREHTHTHESAHIHTHIQRGLYEKYTYTHSYRGLYERAPMHTDLPLLLSSACGLTLLCECKQVWKHDLGRSGWWNKDVFKWGCLFLTLVMWLIV